MITKNKGELKRRYNKAKEAKVGDIIKCPSCGSIFKKTNYQSAFCKELGGTVCKDYYWNNVIETKRNNTTRISPANAAFKETYFNEDFDDDQSWDAHKTN